jgi:transcription antitermination factor NusG
VYAVSGVQGVLKYLGQPAVVRPAEIQNLQLLLQESSAVSIVSERIAPGSLVLVTAGPLKGMYATAVEELNAYRLQISLEALGVAYAVSVPKQFVQLL